MRTRNGEEYISSKDACAIGGCNEHELWLLCLEGKVKFCYLRGGYFIEKNSFLSQIRNGALQTHVPVDIRRGVEAWHMRRFKRFFLIMTVAGCFIVLFILPILFLGNEHSFVYEAAQSSSAYNSISPLSEAGHGNMAAVISMNNVLAEWISRVFIFAYDSLTALFK